MVFYRSAGVDKTMDQQLTCIPPRNCVVHRNQDRLVAWNEIKKWVQEQGVAIGPEDTIERVAQDLLVYWDNMPQNFTSVEFKKVAFRQVRYRYITVAGNNTEWMDARITDI